ncbi:glycosyltransferase [Rivibacter subsaxonicus]|uniref:glycosyltransferase n=1 Tax=Rivibacter subsaxonicus TaxID=457575 RepID=UPI0013EE6BA8|nr:glycosyltransferase [Rivibacter subsaxonicus]
MALVWPFNAPSNRYIELHKMLLREIGYEPRALSLWELLCGGWTQLLSRRTLVTIHWLEGRPFRSTGRGLSLTGVPTVACYVLLMLIMPARTAYFIHNHSVHDATGVWKRLSVGVIALLARVARVRVVHDPSACDAYAASYLPHPLYWDAPDARPPVRRSSEPGHLRVTVLGRIRPYKRIDELLEHWPQDMPLLVAGRCAPDDELQLRAIIARRGLEPSVRLDCGFVDDEAFSAFLDQTDVLLLPHAPGSMLVSGAFFEAFGRVPLIVARGSPFMRLMAEQHSNVHVYELPQDLAALLVAIRQGWMPADADPRAAVARAQFGWSACVRAYRGLLGGTPIHAEAEERGRA